MEQSTTDTTTEWVSKKFSVPASTYLTKSGGFNKITTLKPPPTTAETMSVSEKVGNPSGTGQDGTNNKDSSGSWDQTAEFSENSEVYIENHGELKHPDQNQAMLFQDMVEDPPKKGPVNYHNMKGM